jgi:hypothetical protein
MAILTVHHWENRIRGLHELRRIARKRVVVLTWDPAGPEFWLTEHYFPALLARDKARFPALGEIAGVLGAVQVRPVPVPKDCIDGFLGAYWGRPLAYLDPDARAGMSGFVGIEGVSEGLARLEVDLDSGEWQRRFGAACSGSQLDIGYRLVIAELQ